MDNESPGLLLGMKKAVTRPCDRCEEFEATRFGRAQVMDGSKARWMDVGLCARCAAVCAAPGSPRSSMGTDHSF